MYNPHSNHKDSIYRKIKKEMKRESIHMTTKNQLKTKEGDNRVNEGSKKSCKGYIKKSKWHKFPYKYTIVLNVSRLHSVFKRQKLQNGLKKHDSILLCPQEMYFKFKDTIKVKIVLEKRYIMQILTIKKLTWLNLHRTK